MSSDNHSDSHNHPKSKSLLDRLASLRLSFPNHSSSSSTDSAPHPASLRPLNPLKPHPTAHYNHLASDVGSSAADHRPSPSFWSAAFGSNRHTQVPTFSPTAASRRPAQSKTWRCPPPVPMPKPIVSRPIPMPQPDLRPQPPIAFPIPITALASSSSPQVSTHKPLATKPVPPPPPPPPPQNNVQTTGGPVTPPPARPRPHPVTTPPKPPITPDKQKKNGLANSPQTTPDPSVTPQRCAGTTQNGKACTRKPMKAGTPTKKSKQPYGLTAAAWKQLDEIVGDEGGLPRFCFQHLEQGLRPSGYYVRSQYIQYKDWISEQLPEQTRILLRTEMEKPVTEVDRTTKGYIYCHEMAPKAPQQAPNRSRPPTTYIKIGRSKRPVARLGEWTRQCPSRDPIARGFFPEKEGGGNCLQVGQQKLSPEGLQFHHRWERLCLIEVAGWALLQKSQRDQLDGLNKNDNQEGPLKECMDCGRVHVELFELDQGAFDHFVRELILKWQRWCMMAYL